MRSTFCKAIFAFLALGALVLCGRSGYAADAPATTQPAVVHVKYASGETEVDHFGDGTKLFLDKPDTLRKCPAALRKMMFTRRMFNKTSDVTIDAAKGAEVFLIFNSADVSNDLRKLITDAGWKRGSQFPPVSGWKYDVYTQVCADAVHFTIPAQGTRPVIVAAANLQVESSIAATRPSSVAGAATRPAGGSAAKTATPSENVNPVVSATAAPTVIELGGTVDQVRTGGGGRFLVFHVKDSNELTVVDTQAEKIVKKIPAEGDICYCLNHDKLVLVLNNQQVIQRWDLATLAREKTVMLPDDQPVKRAVMGSAGAGPLMMWTDGGCKLFDVGTLKALTVNGAVQNNVGFGPWVSSDGLTVCDWGWSSGPYSLMRLSNLTSTSVDCRVVNGANEDFNESWAMPSADGTQLIRHGAVVFDASTDALVALAPGPLKDATVLPTQDPRFLIAVRGEGGDNKTSSVAIVSAFDRRVLYTLRKAVPVTGGMIGTRSGRICSEPRVHYLPADNKLVLIPNSDNKVVIYPLDLSAALKATGADYLYVISKPRTVLLVGQQFDYQMETLSSAGGLKYKLEEGPDGLAVSGEGRVTWKALAFGDGGKVPVVITVSDGSGQEITHAVELHVTQKPVPTPDGPAPSPRDSTAGAGRPPKPQAAAPANPPAAPSTPGATKAPDDPELKALAEKLAKKFQEDLNTDSRNTPNNEYTSTFSVIAGSAQRSSGAGHEPAGHMVLGVHEDRAFLVGGDFISYHSHVDIDLKKVNGIWTCTTAQSTLDMASTSHGPLDLPFPPKTHDMTRSIRSLLDDVQNDPAEPKKVTPKPPPNPPAQRA